MSTVSSQPVYPVTCDRDVPMMMRDGTLLRAHVWRPRTEGRFPVLVERVAYELEHRCAGIAEYMASRGYVYVGQNVRGAFISDGAFSPYRDDGWGANRDGYDTVEWAAEQRWSDGKVGTTGGSNSGINQYLLLPTRPPHLVASFVRQAAGSAYHEQLYRGGAYQLQGQLRWSMKNVLDQMAAGELSPAEEGTRRRLQKAYQEIDWWNWHLPLLDCPPLEGLADWHFYDLRNSTDGPYWWPRDLAKRYRGVNTPVLHVGGWFDVFQAGTLSAFRGIQEHARLEECRSAQRLIMGPWFHGVPAIRRATAGEMTFGSNAALDVAELQLRWFDYWLKGLDNGAMDGPAVSAYLVNADRWLHLETWPPPGAEPVRLFLREGEGRDGRSLNNGGLTFEPPAAAERPDSYTYDPDDPVPSMVAFPDYGPRDMRPVEGRMLTYTTAPLERDLALVGEVEAMLYALTTAQDTDWVVRLCDVFPDGRSMSICDGILRGRYRGSFERHELLHAGTIYPFRVDMWSTAWLLRAGHRLRVEVTSSDFPRYDRNLNTGGPLGEEAHGIVAVNTIFHDSHRPSYVTVPVLS